MPEWLTKILGDAKTHWDEMTPNKKVALGAIATALLIGSMLLLWNMRHIRYETLYANMDPQEASAVVEQLKVRDVPYRLTHGGRTIEVPSGRVYEVRLDMASQNLPRGGTVGYEIFDKTNLGMTDFLQKVNYHRALEGELTKTIMELREVQAARVHLVIPERRLFKEDRKNPTASVLLKLSSSARLNQRQIEGITNLVASSVEGLAPEHITIVDYNGNLLSSHTENDPLMQLSAHQLALQKQVEGYLEQKAQSLLDQVLGPRQQQAQVGRQDRPCTRGSHIRFRTGGTYHRDVRSRPNGVEERRTGGKKFGRSGNYGEHCQQLRGEPDHRAHRGSCGKH